MKFDTHGTLMINSGNRSLIVLDLFRCSTHKLSTILIANNAGPTRFAMLTHFDSKHLLFCVYFISIYHL